jgi:glyoxylase-like metal-dependent hydrolase (beta-lactamase superfamily II)
VTAPLHFPFATPPAEGQLTQIAPGVHWLRLPLPMVLDHVNCYLLDDGDGWTLVDCGLATTRSKAIFEALLSGPLAAKPLRRLIVTHHHPDHIGLAGWLMAKGVELLIPCTAWLYARMLILDRQETHSPESLLFARRAGLSEAQLTARASERPFNFADSVAPLPQGFTRLAEGDILTAGQRRWRVHFGQGHAPDHAVLFSLDDTLVLAGDQILPGISPLIAVYPSEPAEDPLTAFLAATAALTPHARDDHLVLPGHKLPFTGLPRRMAEMVDHHEQALSRLRAHLATPQIAPDCFSQLFKRPVTPATFGMALGETLAHLNCLLTRGLVTRTLTPQGAWAWTAI